MKSLVSQLVFHVDFSNRPKNSNKKSVEIKLSVSQQVLPFAKNLSTSCATLVLSIATSAETIYQDIRLPYNVPPISCVTSTTRVMWGGTLLYLSALLAASPGVRGKLKVDTQTGLYTGFTVKISDQVPRQFCKQTLEKLEVSRKKTFRSLEYIVL